MKFGGGGGAARNASSAQSHGTDKDSLSKKAEHVYDAKVLGMWKKAVNTIIFKRIIKQYAPILIELGVDLDSDSDEDDEDDDEDDDESEKSVAVEPKKQVNFAHGLPFLIKTKL